MNKIISASILGCNITEFKTEIRRAEKADVNWIHFDVMDGIFVNNISFGIPVLNAVRQITNQTLDVHLMITEPARYIKQFADNGADIITFHFEACENVAETIKICKGNNVKTGISIKPNTELDSILPYAEMVDIILMMTVEPGFGGQGFIYETLDKIKSLRAYIDKQGLKTLIQVDGGINAETAVLVKEAGADVLVSGTYLFGSADMAQTVHNLKL